MPGMCRCCAADCCCGGNVGEDVPAGMLSYTLSSPVRAAKAPKKASADVSPIQAVRTRTQKQEMLGCRLQAGVFEGRKSVPLGLHARDRAVAVRRYRMDVLEAQQSRGPC